MHNRCNLITLQTLALMQEKYQRDPSSISGFWQSFFSGIELASLELYSLSSEVLDVFSLIQSYRKWGHLKWRNPEQEPWQLALKTHNLSEKDLPKTVPSFGFFEGGSTSLENLLSILQRTYAGKIGFEYEQVEEKIQGWIQAKIEPFLSQICKQKKKELFFSLMKAEGFEQFLQTRYTGKKRFSLEGLETFIPVMESLLKTSQKEGAKKAVIGMPHRGRLNVLSNLLQKKFSVAFYEFENFYQPLQEEGSSDVNYHKGFSTNLCFEKEEMSVKLIANPSHLESVDPVCMGFARAEQDQFFEEQRREVFPILVHGDAAISGQGIVYECLQMSRLQGYEIGGGVHIVLDNEIGFTANPEETRSTMYPTDIAKAFSFPVFHVRAEEVEEAFFVAELASLIRQKFAVDVFIHLLGCRKYGHNETDEPSFTQPQQYEILRKKKTIFELYQERLIGEGIFSLEEAKKEKENFFLFLEQEKKQTEKYKQTPPSFKEIHGREKKQDGEEQKVETALSKEKILFLVEKCTKIPEGFSIHSKLEKLLEARKKIEEIDFAFAETLAFASLLEEGISVRLSGQDCCRGTFSHRHAAWIDQKKGKRYLPLQHIREGQASFYVYNSLLSEQGVLGFEYGYNQAFLEGLTLWEAQYGDFANAAQVIIDQYISSSKKKWEEVCSLTLLLPHGYEGGGPEHSSARIERFLQLSANNNWYVVNPTTASQYFHLLRRQAKSKNKKPLIVFTPKSFLRNPLCKSALKEFLQGSFSPILEETISFVEAVVFCTGKIYYELLQKREELKKEGFLFLRIEQLYPVDTEKLKEIAERYPLVKRHLWVQEEPENMGAWYSVASPLKTFFPQIEYIGRKREETPSSGAFSRHISEQKEIIERVFL